MLQENLKLGMKVTISSSCEYYSGWRDVVATVVGLNIPSISKYTSKADMNKVDVTIREEGIGDTDGWGAEDLLEYVEM